MKRYHVLALLFVLLFLVAGLSAPASAAGGITITRSDATFTFQKEARFTLEATSDSDIVKATLRFRLANQSATNANEKTVEPGRTVKVEHVWKLTSSDMPSGAVVTYWWTVEDKAGNKVESERKAFTYEDTRFTWKKLSSEGIMLAWYRGDDSLGRDLLNAAVGAYQRMASEYGVERAPASIYIYGSFADLQSGIGESAQEWTGGRAYPEYNVVLIGVPPDQMSFGRKALVHEFTHLIVHRATSNPFGDLPRWLDEGLAMWSEGDLDPEYKAALNQAVKSNQLLSLKTLSSNFPADAKQATLAYAESYSVIGFIRTTFGPQKIGDLLKIFKEGSADDVALQRAIGQTTDQIDTSWRASLGLGSTLQGQPAAPQQPQPAAQPSSRSIPRNTLLLIGLGLIGGAVLVLFVLVLVVVLIVRS